jgi:dienelactone hydrolase
MGVSSSVTRHLRRVGAVGALALVASSTADSQAAAAARIPPTFRSGDIELAYRIDRPPGNGPHPAIVLGHGSGRVRKEDSAEIAARFVAAGYAVLRYDKRGVGESGGVYTNVGTSNSEKMFALLAADMAAGLRHLRTLPGIDVRRVGFAGASQAGWIIPVALTLAPEAKFAVIFSGPTVSVGLEIFYSSLAEHGTMTPAAAEAQLGGYRGPQGFDPQSHLRRVSVPVLWLFGAEDGSIPTKRCVEILASLVRGERKRFTWIVYPGADHGLRGADVWADVRPWLDRIAR